MIEKTAEISFFPLFLSENMRIRSRAVRSAENRKSYVEIRWIIMLSFPPSFRLVNLEQSVMVMVGGENRRFDRLPVVTRN